MNMNRFKILLSALPPQVQRLAYEHLDVTTIDNGMTAGRIEDRLLEVQEKVRAEIIDTDLVAGPERELVLALLLFFATAGVEAIFTSDYK